MNDKLEYKKIEYKLRVTTPDFYHEKCYALMKEVFDKLLDILPEDSTLKLSRELVEIKEHYKNE